MLSEKQRKSFKKSFSKKMYKGKRKEVLIKLPPLLPSTPTTKELILKFMPPAQGKHIAKFLWEWKLFLDRTYTLKDVRAIGFKWFSSSAREYEKRGVVRLVKDIHWKIAITWKELSKFLKKKDNCLGMASEYESDE